MMAGFKPNIYIYRYFSIITCRVDSCLFYLKDILKCTHTHTHSASPSYFLAPGSNAVSGVREQERHVAPAVFWIVSANLRVIKQYISNFMGMRWVVAPYGSLWDINLYITNRTNTKKDQSSYGECP